MLTQRCNDSLSEFLRKIYTTLMPCSYHCHFKQKYLGYRHGGIFDVPKTVLRVAKIDGQVFIWKIELNYLPHCWQR